MIDVCGGSDNRIFLLGLKRRRQVFHRNEVLLRIIRVYVATRIDITLR